MTRPQQSLERVAPKFPHNISVIDQVDSSSTGEDRDREFPIMSISKSFCGAVSALMAVDGKFGSNGIDATISEALTAAISNYPERQERIEQYLQMLEDKGLGDIRLSELLTHRSGIIETKSEPAAYKDRPVSEFISEKLSMGTGRGKYAYFNSGFTLMEEIINLTSDSGYENELKVRIFDKCELSKTGDLHKSEEALARVGQVVLAPGMNIPMKDEVSQVFQEYDFEKNEPLGRVSLSAGGLSSTVNDMEKYSVELTKMIVGQPSALTAGLEEEKAQKIKEIYISSADKKIGETAKESDSYSFGVEIHVQKDGTFVVQHGGNFAANAGMMSVTASVDRREFSPTISMNKSDYLTQILVNENSQTAAIVLEYFNSKLNAEEQKQFSTIAAKENFLIQERRLPIEFIDASADQPSLRDQIFAGFGGFRQEMSDHLISAGYLNEDGVIDGVRVKNDFQNLQQDSTEISSTGRRAAEKVLAKSEDLLSSEKVENLAKKQHESWVQMTYIRMEDPYYWRNKVMFWRAVSEAYSRDSENSSDLTWAEVVGKEKLQDQGQNQSAISKLWYKEGMQIDLNSNTDMADSLKDIMKHIKDMAIQVKKDGTSDIWQGTADDLVELRNDPEGLKLKALAVAALAEADGHAPEAKKILDQVGSEKRKKLTTDSKQIIKPPSPQNSGR